MAIGKILIADDEPDIVRLLEFVLERKGFDVISAHSGEAVVGLAEEEMPDLILLDVLMPVVDGLEVCRRLKKNSKTRGIPVAMLSAKSQKTEIREGLEMGATEYICKPFDPKEIVAKVTEIIEEHRQHIHV